METAIGIALGLGLSAACGFRVFVPLLVLAVAGATDFVTLAAGFDWLTTPAALSALSVATALEIAAYYIPWLDNLLDAIASPAALFAGAFVAVAAQAGNDPLLHWSLMAIAGGGAAGVVQAASVVLRGASSALTGGVGNVVVSTMEWTGSLFLSALALIAPIVAVSLVALAPIVIFSTSRQRRARRSAAVARGVAP